MAVIGSGAVPQLRSLELMKPLFRCAGVGVTRHVPEHSRQRIQVYEPDCSALAVHEKEWNV